MATVTRSGTCVLSNCRSTKLTHRLAMVQTVTPASVHYVRDLLMYYP